VEEDIRIQLVRMEGKLDLMNAHQEMVKADVIDLRNRVIILETDKNQREGQARGIGLSVKAVQFILGAGVMGLIATILRAFRV
jgi:hypothetical protein